MERKLYIFVLTMMIVSFVLALCSPTVETETGLFDVIPEENEITVRAVKPDKVKKPKNTEARLYVQEEEVLPITDEELELISLIVVAESEGQSELCQRLVVDVILNQLDHEKHPDTIHDVIYAKNNFECLTNGRVDRCVVTDDIRQLVREEVMDRTNYDVVFFRADYYHDFGTPVMSVGNTYFSSY